jgi:endonuclease YncB( thermonuclease family)
MFKNLFNLNKSKPINIIHNEEKKSEYNPGNTKIFELLSTISLKDCSIYMPSITFAKVVKVYDGDTITIATYLDDLKSQQSPYKFSLRLYGIDTPELRSSSDIEKKAGYFVKQKLEERILGKIVKVKLHDKYDKYGRLLGYIYDIHEGQENIQRETKETEETEEPESISINQWLIDNKYAYPYDGTTKSKINWSYLVS